MRLGRLLVVLAVLLVAGSAQAASYLQIDGTVVDPIQWRACSGCPNSAHPYAGPNLEPGVSAPGANLGFADLSFADLSFANLTFANLTRADLSGADLRDANLSLASRLGETFGIPDYNALTDFTGTGFDPVAAGWNLIPEPTTGLLLGLGLLGVAVRQRV